MKTRIKVVAVLFALLFVGVSSAIAQNATTALPALDSKADVVGVLSVRFEEDFGTADLDYVAGRLAAAFPNGPRLDISPRQATAIAHLDGKRVHVVGKWEVETVGDNNSRQISVGSIRAAH